MWSMWSENQKQDSSIHFHPNDKITVFYSGSQWILILWVGNKHHIKNTQRLPGLTELQTLQRIWWQLVNWEKINRANLGQPFCKPTKGTRTTSRNWKPVLPVPLSSWLSVDFQTKSQNFIRNLFSSFRRCASFCVLCFCFFAPFPF